MNKRLAAPLLAVATVLATALAPSRVVASPLVDALIGAPGCDHVIDLLLRYGPLEGRPALAGGLAMPSPLGGFVLPVAEIGDLCIDSVEACPLSGDGFLPAFVVSVTNHSGRPVCNTHVSIVALLGPIKACDPSATVCVEEIPAGATVEVELTLPAEALAMGAHAGAPVGFHQLLVAIDSFDRFVESDEANNLRMLCRDEIPVRAVIETTEVVEPVSPIDGAIETPVGAPTQTAPPLDAALEKFGIDVSGTDVTAERL